MLKNFRYRHFVKKMFPKNICMYLPTAYAGTDRYIIFVYVFNFFGNSNTYGNHFRCKISSGSRR